MKNLPQMENELNTAQLVNILCLYDDLVDAETAGTSGDAEGARARLDEGFEQIRKSLAELGIMPERKLPQGRVRYLHIP